MKNQSIMVLHITIDRSSNPVESFVFNDTMLQAISSGLCAVYEEVFIWSLDQHVAVWVSGNSAEALLKIFSRYQKHYNNVQLLQGKNAIQLLSAIVSGRLWNSFSMKAKQRSFECGFELACEMTSLGQSLSHLINQCSKRFNQEPVISGYANSWKVNEAGISDFKKLAFESLYRFSLN